MNGRTNSRIDRIDRKDMNSTTLKIDPEIFDRDIVLATCYTLLDRAHFIVDKKNDNFLVKIIPREDNIDMEKLILEFNDHLINYSVYYKNAKNNAEIKKLLIGTSLYVMKDKKFQ